MTDVLAPRAFPLGAVLTITAGSLDRPFCRLADLYSVLGFLRADVPAAAEVQAAIDECRPIVLGQYPDLENLVAPASDAPDAWVLQWLADREAQFGPVLELSSPGARA